MLDTRTIRNERWNMAIVGRFAIRKLWLVIWASEAEGLALRLNNGSGRLPNEDLVWLKLWFKSCQRKKQKPNSANKISKRGTKTDANYLRREETYFTRRREVLPICLVPLLQVSLSSPNLAILAILPATSGARPMINAPRYAALWFSVSCQAVQSTLLFHSLAHFLLQALWHRQRESVASISAGAQSSY